MVLHASAIAGACAGLVPSIITCPLDVVKTRLQASSYAAPSTSRAAARSTADSIAAQAHQQQHSYAAAASSYASSAKGKHPEGRAPPTVGIAAAEKAAVLDAVTDRWATAKDGSKVAARPSAAEVERQYQGIVGTVRRIWMEDGIKGFYRGLGPTIFGYLPTWAIYFTVYDAAKSGLAAQNPSGEEDFVNHIISAMTAGAASTCCTSPLWVVKTRFMLQSARDAPGQRYRHTGDAFVQIWRTEGWRGFYRGLLPSLFGVSHVAVQFPLYESFKSWSRQRQENPSDDLSPGRILFCSSSAKMIASVVTYPHEVLRTRLQMQPSRGSTATPNPPAAAAAGSTKAKAAEYRHLDPSRGGGGVPQAARELHTAAAAATAAGARRPGRRPRSGLAPLALPSVFRRGHKHMGNTGMGGKYTGVIQACQTIAAEEGLRGFYRGMGVNLMRTVPSSALTILTYELVMQQLTSEHDDEHHDAPDAPQAERE